MPSPPALINRSLWVFPGVNLKLLRPPLAALQGVVSPAATVEQLKVFFPLMRLLSEDMICGLSQA
jgi:hypothetical protein